MLRINAENSPRGVNEDVYLDEDGAEEAADGAEDETKEDEDADVDIESTVEGAPFCMWIDRKQCAAHILNDKGLRSACKCG